MSVFNNKLLVSSRGLSLFSIYSCAGHHISSIRITHNDTLCDATWIPSGDIVYTSNSNKVVALFASFGQLITMHTCINEPKYLSVSNDDVIFLADFSTGV